MHAPAAPRPPSASTALTVTGARPPRRGPGARIALVLVLLAVIAAIGGGAYAMRDSIDGFLEDVGDGGGGDRIAVSTDLHGGLRWSMSETPIEEERTNPVPDGTMVTVSMWAANPAGMLEVVGVFERRPAFDIDQAMAGTGFLFGGEMVDIETIEVDGLPARTGTIVGMTALGDGSGVGRMTMVLGEEGVAMAISAGDDRRADDLDGVHEPLVDSLRFG
jgi:hypothetical protein